MSPTSRLCLRHCHYDDRGIVVMAAIAAGNSSANRIGESAIVQALGTNLNTTFQSFRLH
jgi:hypothetical protein